MKREDLTEKLLDIKREKGWSWKHICEKIGGYSEVLVVGAIMGQMKLTKPQAANAGELFSLSKSIADMMPSPNSSSISAFQAGPLTITSS